MVVPVKNGQVCRKLVELFSKVTAESLVMVLQHTVIETLTYRAHFLCHILGRMPGAICRLTIGSVVSDPFIYRCVSIMTVYTDVHTAIFLTLKVVVYSLCAQ